MTFKLFYVIPNISSFYNVFFIFLFPLYSRWRFGGDVVADAVDAMYFVDDLVGDFRHEVVWQVRPVSGHGIG